MFRVCRKKKPDVTRLVLRDTKHLNSPPISPSQFEIYGKGTTAFMSFSMWEQN